MHSYNECDKNFGLIEIKKKRTKTDFFIPDHWAQLIVETSPKFMVVRMSDEDFVSVDVLNSYFKDTVQGIRSMQWLRFEKEHPETLFFRTISANIVEEFETYSMKLTRRGRKPTFLRDLPPETKKPALKQAKLKNILELLEFVPPEYHEFFQSLPQHRQNDQAEEETNNPNTEPADLDEPDTIYDTDDSDDQ